MKHTYRKKPVYSLAKGEIFKATDNLDWVVFEVQEPEGYRCLPQIGETPKAFTVTAGRAGKERKFYLHGCKIVEVRDGHTSAK